MSINALIIGSNSDIYRGIRPFMIADGWNLHEKAGVKLPPDGYRWDACIITYGKLAPVGMWWDLDGLQFEHCIYSNLMLPIRALRSVWGMRNPEAKICFFAGPNPNKPMEGYVAYSIGKMALLKAVEHMDFESPDAAFFALGPGYVPTKIHQATRSAQWRNARLEQGGEGTPMEDIYAALQWCLRQPKNVVGGRNICVSDIKNHPATLACELSASVDKFKLRRCE